MLYYLLKAQQLTYDKAAPQYNSSRTDNLTLRPNSRNTGNVGWVSASGYIIDQLLPPVQKKIIAYFTLTVPTTGLSSHDNIQSDPWCH